MRHGDPMPHERHEADLAKLLQEEPEHAKDLALSNIEATFWNGLPTPAERGTAIVADSPAFPAYWARDIVGHRVPVVRVVLDGVNYGGGIAWLYDINGLGWLKVTEGRGSPGYGHRDMSIVEGSFQPSDRKAKS